MFRRTAELEEQKELEFEAIISDIYKPKICNWVVKFATKKTIHHFVGQVTNIIDGDPEVKFTRIG